MPFPRALCRAFLPVPFPSRAFSPFYPLPFPCAFLLRSFSLCCVTCNLFTLSLCFSLSFPWPLLRPFLCLFPCSSGHSDHPPVPSGFDCPPVSSDRSPYPGPKIFLIFNFLKCLKLSKSVHSNHFRTSNSFSSASKSPQIAPPNAPYKTM